MTTSDRFRPIVIEFAGLPGSGKTTVLNSITETNDRFLAHSVRIRGGRHEEVPKTSVPSVRRDFVVHLLPWLVTPITVFIFRSFLVRLAWLIVVHRLRFIPGIGGISDDEKPAGRVPGLMLILNRINWVVARRFQVRIRARRSRKSILVEQGFVQEAISIHMRLPEQWRDSLWEAYLSGIPKSCLTVVLQISASSALNRVGSREVDHPSLRFFKWANSSWQIDGGDEALGRVFEEVEVLLKSEHLRSRSTLRYVEAGQSPSAVLSDVHEIVVRLSDSG